MSIEQQHPSSQAKTPQTAAAHGAGPRYRAPSPARRLLGKRVTLVALLAVFAALLLKDSGVFEPSYEDIYREYEQILAQTQALAERNASDAEWAEFEKNTMARLKPITDELSELCERRPAFEWTIFGMARRDSKTATIRLPLYDIGHDLLPMLIAEARKRGPIEPLLFSVTQPMQRVRTALDAIGGASEADNPASRDQ